MRQCRVVDIVVESDSLESLIFNGRLSVEKRVEATILQFRRFREKKVFRTNHKLQIRHVIFPPVNEFFFVATENRTLTMLRR